MGGYHPPAYKGHQGAIIWDNPALVQNPALSGLRLYPARKSFSTASSTVATKNTWLALLLS